MSESARPRPRRRPKLRVVGEARAHDRHAFCFQIGETWYAVEMWTEAEFSTLHPAERPPWWMPVPRFGPVTVQVITEAEAADLIESSDRWAGANFARG